MGELKKLTRVYMEKWFELVDFDALVVKLLEFDFLVNPTEYPITDAFRDDLLQAMDLKKLFVDVRGRAVEKFFTENEIRELIHLLEMPIYRKWLKKTLKIEEEFQPCFLEWIKDFMETEFPLLTKKHMMVDPDPLSTMQEHFKLLTEFREIKKTKGHFGEISKKRRSDRQTRKEGGKR